MKNIEVKCPLPDRAEIERRLGVLGAALRWTRTQRDTFYLVPRGWLKLREQQGDPPQLISYVRATSRTDPRPSDYDVAPVDDVALWHSLLGRVLPVDMVVRKERTLWTHGRTRIHLDRVEDLGDHLELETVVGDDVEAATRETERIVDALGLDRESFLSVPYRDLLSGESSGAAGG